MKTSAMKVPGKDWRVGSKSHSSAHIYRPGFLHLLTPYELAELQQALQHGETPLDFQDKLSRLSKGDLVHRYVAKHCSDFINLLLAAENGLFREARHCDLERLLSVLAYVRKDDDAIPDYRPDGLLDDQQEIHAAAIELAPLLQTFKAWHLQHQVPALWVN
jgi:hypothetical protein